MKGLKEDAIPLSYLVCPLYEMLVLAALARIKQAGELGTIDHVVAVIVEMLDGKVVVSASSVSSTLAGLARYREFAVREKVRPSLGEKPRLVYVINDAGTELIANWKQNWKRADELMKPVLKEETGN